MSFLHLELVPLRKRVAQLLHEGETDSVCLDVGELGEGTMDGLPVSVISLHLYYQSFSASILDVFPIFGLKNIKVSTVSLGRVKRHDEGKSLHLFSVHSRDCSPGLVGALVLDQGDPYSHTRVDVRASVYIQVDYVPERFKDGDHVHVPDIRSNIFHTNSATPTWSLDNEGP